MNKAEAKAALSPAAARRAGARLIDAMLNREANEFIVLFKDHSPARVAVNADKVQRLAMQKNSFHTTRQSVRAASTSADIEFVHEYSYLPSALIRTHSSAALVRLLNHPNVSAWLNTPGYCPTLRRACR